MAEGVGNDRPSAERLRFGTAELYQYMQKAWPEASDTYAPERFVELWPSHLRYHYPVTPDDLRPGQTVSGPTLMRLADIVSYALILAHLGEAALAVTTSLSIDFLRRPVGPVIVADCSMVKLGRSLAVFRVTMASAPESMASAPEGMASAPEGMASAPEGMAARMDRPEAVANVTYSLALT